MEKNGGRWADAAEITPQNLGVLEAKFVILSPWLQTPCFCFIWP